MSTPRSTPFYFISKENPLIEEHRPSIEAAIALETKGLLIEATPAIVDLQDVKGAHNVVLAVQHFPTYIEPMLFTLRFGFREKEDMELLMPEHKWKITPKFHRWFNSMRTLPLLPFFVFDREVRLLILGGDYTLRDTWAAIRHPDADPKSPIKIGGLARIQLSKRLADSCYQLMTFCHGSGFNPKAAIETVLAQYSLPVHYIDIYHKFQKHLRDYKGGWKPMDAGATHKPVW